jgi:hypothetical protein
MAAVAAAPAGAPSNEVTTFAYSRIDSRRSRRAVIPSQAAGTVVPPGVPWLVPGFVTPGIADPPGTLFAPPAAAPGGGVAPEETPPLPVPAPVGPAPDVVPVPLPDLPPFPTAPVHPASSKTSKEPVLIRVEFFWSGLMETSAPVGSTTGGQLRTPTNGL